MGQIVVRYWPTPPEHEVEEAGDRVLNRLRDELQKHDMSLRSLYGDGWNAPPLNQHDFRVLTAASILGGQGTPMRVLEIVENWTESSWVIEKTSLSRDRLISGGLMVASRSGPARESRGCAGDRRR